MKSGLKSGLLVSLFFGLALVSTSQQVEAVDRHSMLRKNGTEINFASLDEKDELEGYYRLDEYFPVKLDNTDFEDYSSLINYFTLGNHASAIRYRDIIQDISTVKKAKGTFGASVNSKAVMNSIGFPRIVSYEKNVDKGKPLQYSYVATSDGNNYHYGYSGMGLVKVDANNNQVTTPVKGNVPDAVNLEEYWVNDRHYPTASIAYGTYSFSDGSTVSLKVKIESLDEPVKRGNGRITFTVGNTDRTTLNLMGGYSVHMDVAGMHYSTPMRTLGNNEGIYFTEKNSKTNNVPYFVSFQTDTKSSKVKEPDYIDVFEIKEGDRKNLFPPTWYEYGPIYDGLNQHKNRELYGEDEKERGEILPFKDPKTQRYIDGVKNSHPAWMFGYDNMTIEPGDNVSFGLTVKSTDIPDIKYPNVEVKTTRIGDRETGKYPDLNTKAKQVVTYRQNLKNVDVTIPEYAPRKLTIKTKPNPNYSHFEYKVYRIYTKNGREQRESVGNQYYRIAENNDSGTTDIIFGERNSQDMWNFHKGNDQIRADYLEIEQITDLDTTNKEKNMADYHFKASDYQGTNLVPKDSYFDFKNEAHNEAEIGLTKKDGSVYIENLVQNKKTKGEQIYQYHVNLAGDIKPELKFPNNTETEPLNSDDYILNLRNNDFSWNTPTVTSKITSPDKFEGNNVKVPFDVELTSETFNQSNMIKGEAYVQNEVNATIHFVIEENGKKVPIKKIDLNNLPSSDNKLVIVDPITKAVKPETFVKEILSTIKQIYTGYELKPNGIELKVDGNTTTVTDVTKVPGKDVDIYLNYFGKTLTVVPEELNFGSEQLRAKKIEDVRPNQEHEVRVIDTTGESNAWKLEVKESTAMNQDDLLLNKELFFAFDDNQEALRIDRGYQPVLKSESNQILHQLALNTETNKQGIFMNIFNSNLKGKYSGTLTWQLSNTK